MALNPNIILSAQGPDIMGALRAGTLAAAETNALRDQNALRSFMADNGAAVMQGDRNALAGLAGLDINQAMNVQQTQLGMDATRLNMDATRQNMRISEEDLAMRRAAARREAEAALAQNAAQMTAAQLEQERQTIKTGLSGAAFFYQKGDRAGYERFLASKGIDPAQYPFEQFPAHAATFEGVLEALETFAPKTPDPADRYKVVGGSLIDLQAPEGPKQVLTGAMPEETVFGPDGRPVIMRGGPGTAVKFTEAQSKDNVYATRAEGVLPELDAVAGSLTSFPDRLMQSDPTGVVRGNFQSEDYQLASRAGKEFLATILRKDTGAAVTPSEEAMYGEIFLPQPGDQASVQEAKRIARARAVEAIKAGMSPDQIMTVGRGLVATAERTGAAPAPATGATGQTSPAPVQAGDQGSQPPALSPEVDAWYRQYRSAPTGN